MHRKIYLSSGMTVGLVILSIAALAVSNKELPAGNIRVQNSVLVYRNVNIDNELIIHTEPAIAEVQCHSQRIELNEDEKCMLAKIAMAEAEGEDTQGKALVMSVVLNRVHSNKFPDNVYDIIHQKGQFSPVEDGRYYSSEPDADCMAALDLIINGWNESRGALYFESDSSSTWHRRHLKFLFQHGKHMFYTESE